MNVFLTLMLVSALSVVSSTPGANTGFINPLIGNTGDTPNGSGGMIPSVAPPFGMTRWVAQTHENFVSRTPYNYSDSQTIHGFIGTHQPAIWMGESGSVVIAPGVGERVKGNFSERGLDKVNGSEVFGIGRYMVDLKTGNDGIVSVVMSASKAQFSADDFTYEYQHRSLACWPHILPFLASKKCSIGSPAIYPGSVK